MRWSNGASTSTTTSGRVGCYSTEAVRPYLAPLLHDGVDTPEPAQLTVTTTPAIFGPAATKWFAFLPKAVRIPGRPNLEIFSRVMVDQCVFATANLGCFLSTMALLEGSSPKDKLREAFIPAYKKNWMVWPGVQILNFKFVPLESRVLVVNCVALGMVL